jgi:GTP 3',8-cyclase
MESVREPATAYWLGSSLYLNITNQCSNNCWFCFRNYKTGIADFNHKLKQEPTTTQVISELKNILPSRRWSEIVFCGFGEPTAKLDVLVEVANWVKTQYLEIPIRLDTNGHGYLLNLGRNVAEELKAAGLTKVSVSLNGHDDETYRENCRPNVEGKSFEATLDFIRKVRAVGLEVDVSAIRMPEVDIQKVKEVTEGLGVAFRIRDYIPCFW